MEGRSVGLMFIVKISFGFPLVQQELGCAEQGPEPVFEPSFSIGCVDGDLGEPEFTLIRGDGASVGTQVGLLEDRSIVFSVFDRLVEKRMGIGEWLVQYRTVDPM